MTATAAGGMHPTGMHSCFEIALTLKAYVVDSKKNIGKKITFH